MKKYFFVFLFAFIMLFSFSSSALAATIFDEAGASAKTLIPGYTYYMIQSPGSDKYKVLYSNTAVPPFSSDGFSTFVGDSGWIKYDDSTKKFVVDGRYPPSSLNCSLQLSSVKYSSHDLVDTAGTVVFLAPRPSYQIQAGELLGEEIPQLVKIILPVGLGVLSALLAAYLVKRLLLSFL